MIDDKKEYVSPQWQQVLKEQGIGFRSLWRLELEPLDVPNTGRTRSGWSSVSVLTIRDKNKEKRRLVLKRLQNHLSRTLLHPFRGVPILRKEFSNMMHFRELGIPGPHPVFYGEHHGPDGYKAILLTAYLNGYKSLAELVSLWQQQGWPSPTERRKLVKTAAQAVRKLHDERLQHNCLYPKHLLVAKAHDRFVVRFIDLEKTKWRAFGHKWKVRDLETLYRRSAGWTNTDRLWFLKTYCGVESLDKVAKRLVRRIMKQNQRKRDTDS